MRITRLLERGEDPSWSGWHILTVAEDGFSMLDIYGNLQRGVPGEVLRDFAHRVNFEDETGTLYPQFPISAIPRRFLRGEAMQDGTRPRRDVTPRSRRELVDDLKRQVKSFIDANRTVVRARQILVDLHVSPARIPEDFLTAIEETFRLHGSDGSIDEVVIKGVFD